MARGRSGDSSVADRSAGPAQLILLASVARRYYLDGRSKIEIAEEFGLSRFKVARLIDTARETGLVHIEIRHEGVIDVDLSARLRDRFELAHAVVVQAPDDDPAAVRRHLGRAAAELLGEVLTPHDVLGLAWARSVGAMASVLPRLPGVPVVQLTGALSQHDGDHSSIDIVRDVARAAGGPAYVFYAPFVVRDAATARALRQQPEVARAFNQLPRVTKAVGGVGFWARGESTLYDAVEDRERQALQRLGVCAELSGIFLTADGAPIDTQLSQRMIGIDAQQMRAIPEVIGIAYGMAKLPALRAALRSGLLGGVVTHVALADALLDQP
jgi:DNA-binding transcriptional regulator LsrR (DeoR family)